MPFHSFSERKQRQAMPDLISLKGLNAWIAELECEAAKGMNEPYPSPVLDRLRSQFYAAAPRFRESEFLKPIDHSLLEKQMREMLLANAAKLGIDPNSPDIDKMVAVPDEPTMPELVAKYFPIMWADWRLWAVVRRSSAAPAAKSAQEFISSTYDFYVPFEDSVWRELAEKKVQYFYLLTLMKMTAFNLFKADSPESGDSTAADLNQLYNAVFERVFTRYIRNPHVDQRPWLSLQNLPNAQLCRLRDACKRLAKDASWCASHPGRFEARRAPMISRRVRQPEEALKVELMVEMLRKEPELTDYALAKNCPGCQITAAGRKLAAEARRLAILRDGLPLKTHQQRGSKSS